VNAGFNLLLPLSPLFAALLSGCFSSSSCDDFKGGTYNQTVELTPWEYEQWQMGIEPGQTSGMATSTTDGGAGTGAGDGGGSTGGAGEGGGSGTGGDPTTTGATDPTTSTTTGTMLTDQEICMMVCAKQGGLGEVESCTIGAMLNANGNVTVECVLPLFCEGRSHACVRSHGGAQQTAAAWLARAAHDEAASVHAFLALADELAFHGAPAELLARIHLAAADERRHAALVGELAQRHGASLTSVTITPTPIRDLLALAVENMVEGCVRETWAALSAAHQAAHADTQPLRDLYQTIAADETRHAELAWSIHTWLIAQLGDAEQAMVTAARGAAVRQLHTSLAALTDEPGLLALGVPSRSTALHLLTGLDAALWSQAA